MTTTKVVDDDIFKRGEKKKKKLEYRTASPTFTMVAVLGMPNLCWFFGTVKEAIVGECQSLCEMFMQILLCGVLVLVNLTLYRGLFLRKDKGKMPSSVAVKSVAFALFACTSFAFLY